MGADPCTTPSAPCSKYALTTSGDYRRERREYPILTWHTQNETTRQRHEKNHLCSTKFTTIIFQWHLGMHIRPITHFIIKCRQNWQNTTESKIGHQIHRKHYITPNNLSLDLTDWWNMNNHKKDTSSRGVTTFFAKSVVLTLPIGHNWEPSLILKNCHCRVRYFHQFIIFPTLRNNYFEVNMVKLSIRGAGLWNCLISAFHHFLHPLFQNDQGWPIIPNFSLLTWYIVMKRYVWLQNCLLWHD